ncbi:hypothetical protein [Cylindrospermum sp. FACHB-282]|uniref:hypothetical protein n=1 Tax=Cylindrospermum sp. FACHB-282 TaxID=2692794 RepID=UPI0016826965|nr:hypothetical protein [Cylindrospermum sp. FACHB-282]MBD2386032.1 hypothetical protein [Cylindrospermum sp. FACHB-282]
MATNLTVATAAKLLRNRIGYDEGNDFGGSESSIPASLEISTSKNQKVIDDLKSENADLIKPRLLSLHRSLTRAWAKPEIGVVPTDYKIPDAAKFTIQTKTLKETLASKAETATLELLTAIAKSYPNLVKGAFGNDVLLPVANPASDTPFTGLSEVTQPVELVNDIYETYGLLDNVRVYVVDAEMDAYVGVFIVGEASDGIVISRTLQVQT